MKRFAVLMLLLSLGMFTVGCKKPAETATPPADEPAVEASEGATDEAAADEGAAAATEESAEETTE